ncbi:hypothetical protein [Streptomyces sp. NPDC013457]|uniref:hypothetical protein n=1 Tax=Streptomyces sp. NPDC013457 TaxID=3364866 RepID=UPI0036FACAF0
MVGLLLSLVLELLVQLALGVLLLARYGGGILAAVGAAWLGVRAWATRDGSRLAIPPAALVLVGVGALLIAMAVLISSAGERLDLPDL